MAKTETVLRVFVASPSDVADERERLDDVVRELNLTWPKLHGLRLELRGWEEYATPGFGLDAQDVINTSVPDDCDIFVGILWSRLGTPTGRASSGTVEEFRRAKTRFDADTTSVRILLYFKDHPISPSKVDPDQLRAVNDFRAMVGREGGLYWVVRDTDDFERAARLHLAQCLAAWIERQTSVAKNPDGPAASAISEVLSDDPMGIFDYMEIAETRFSEMTSIALQIASATEQLTADMHASTSHIADLTRGARPPSARAAREALSRPARSMEVYAEALHASIPSFARNMSEGFDAVTRSITMSLTGVPENSQRPDLSVARETLAGLRAVMLSASGALRSLRDSIAATPDLSRDLTRARRRVLAVHDRLLSEFDRAAQLADEANQALSQRD